MLGKKIKYVEGKKIKKKGGGGKGEARKKKQILWEERGGEG